METVEGVGEVPTFLAEVLKQAGGEQGLSSEAVAKALDAADPLSKYREEFRLPLVTDAQRQSGSSGDASQPCVYLCGNSLGLQPKRTQEYVERELSKWAEYGVEGQFYGKQPWVTMDETCVKEMAHIVGAQEEEVVTMSSLTVNLHLMLMSFYEPKGDRNMILIESKAFPSDYMVARSQIEMRGLNPDDCLLMVEPREGEELIRTDDVLDLVRKHADRLALVLLPGIQYYTGQVFEMEKITAEVKKMTNNECNVGFDLAHAVGNVELALHDWNVDFACWCTYKYLNSGPGGIGGAFVHARHFAQDTQAKKRLYGWWGHRKVDRFKMAECFIPSEGAMGWQLSNPAVLTLATLKASLELFEEAGMKAVRSKSLSLTRYLELLLEKELPTDSYKVVTPGFDRYMERGAQLSLVFSKPVKAVHAALEQQGVICDTREPNVMRVAPAPLYNSFQDVFRFVHLLKRAYESS